MQPFYVILVEDEEVIQDLIIETLTDEGCEVHTAARPEDALKLMQQFQPQLILLDKRVPGIPIEEFVASYRATPGPHAPIVLLSASPDAENLALALQLDAFLPKPFDLDSLIDLVQQRRRNLSSQQ